MVFKKNLSLKREKIIAKKGHAENLSIVTQNTNATCSIIQKLWHKSEIQSIVCYIYENVNSMKKAMKNFKKIMKISVKDEKSVDDTTDNMRHKVRVAISDSGDRPNAGKAPKDKQRQLTCDFCQKRFNHTGDFNKHRRKHTGERPYTCNKCQQKFSHVSNLARHQRVHSGIRPFSCEICGRTFARKDKLADHLTTKSCNTKIRNQINQ